jgi:3-oxoacyl-[acyl-carrier-protein] synthase-3
VLRPPPDRFSRIIGWGHYLPEAVVTNADVTARGLDSTDDWIQSRTGIRERRYAAAGETLADMAVRAGEDALTNCGLTPADVDLVIVATCTAAPGPPVAPEVGTRLGLSGAGMYDLNAACAGFVYALQAAAAQIGIGQADTVLVIGVEKFTDWLDPTDRSTAMLFADGAGAGVVTVHSTPAMSPAVWGSDGEQAYAIRIDPDSGAIGQDGQTVYRWATSAMGDAARRVCERAGVDPAELAAFVPHQANLRIVERIADRLGAANAIVARDVCTSGNTSAASIPIAVSKLLPTGVIPSGRPMLLLGFGAGLTYAGMVVESP